MEQLQQSHIVNGYDRGIRHKPGANAVRIHATSLSEDTVCHAECLNVYTYKRCNQAVVDLSLLITVLLRTTAACWPSRFNLTVLVPAKTKHCNTSGLMERTCKNKAMR